MSNNKKIIILYLQSQIIFKNTDDRKIEHTLKNAEGKEYLQYEWLDLDKIDQYPLVPKVIKEILKEENLPIHKINNDMI